MPISDELATLDGTAQAELVRNGEMTPLELVDAAIARIERLNPQLNAVVTPLFDEARKTARGALPEGPLRGVPYLLKDLGAACAGVRYTLGSAFTKDFVALVDAELVLRHRRAGLVCLGKTNTPEFGIQPTTEPLLFGPTHNPWDLSRTPGGSSGGSAAAVAAGLVPLAHANDGGGSIRIPASCCGLFGLKPTRARNPLGPVFGDIMGGFVQEHAVTRSVRDSAALLDATAGPDVGDPYCAQPPARPFLEEVGADPGRLRIAFTTTALNGAAVHADCVAAVQDAAALCEALGHHVEEAAPALDGSALTGMFVTVWAAGCADTVEALAKATGRKAAPAHFEPLTWALYEMGAKVSAASYLNTVTGLQQAARAVARFMSGFDLLLCPTVAEPPPPLGTFDSPPEAPLKGFGRAGEFVPFTQLANMTGQPAMSVPLFWNAAGLPIGAHFMARFGDEAALFRLAAQLEEARPWAGRRPPVFA